MIHSALKGRRIHKTPGLLLILSTLLMASVVGGCDGGLFGTGDGNDTVMVTDAAGSTEQPDTPTTTPATDSNAPVTGINPEAPQDVNMVLSFSNTESSGLNASNTQLPALKIVNLLDEPVTATLEGGNSITASAQASSSLLGVNTGESRVLFSNIDTQVALIDPLSAAMDSITTVLISTQQSGAQTPDLSVFTLSTRAVVSAPGMAQVRLVLAPASEQAMTQPTFTLQSDNSQSAGADVVFTDFFNEQGPLASYSLANAGGYQLMSADNAFPAQRIELLPDQVYTLIITGNTQIPVFIEIDSRVE